MSPENSESKLNTLLTQAVETPVIFSKCPQLYSLQEEDASFIKRELATRHDLDIQLDKLMKLYIAVFLDAIPTQVTENLKLNSQLYLNKKNDEAFNSYLMTLAGLLHEAKLMLTEDTDTLAPYLLSYSEFLGQKPEDALSTDEIMKYFVNRIEDAIQAIIKF